MADQETILVVDDEPEVAAMLREHLEGEGHRVAVTHTLADANHRLGRDLFDLVLLDLDLPDGNGLTLLSDVPRLDAPPDFVIVTGHATLDSALTALKHGAAGYVTKPFDPAQLSELVAQILDRRRLRRENTRLYAALRETGAESEKLAVLADTISSTLSQIRQKLELGAKAAGVPSDMARDLRDAGGAAERLIGLAQDLHRRLVAGADR